MTGPTSGATVSYQISGQVMCPDSAAVAGLTVSVQDCNIDMGPTMVGSTTCDAIGRYTCTFDLPPDRLSGFNMSSPDLQVWVSARPDGRVLGRSAVRYNAGVTESDVNVVLPEGQLLGIEREAMTGGTASVYGGALGGLVELDERRDITQVANRTGAGGLPTSRARIWTRNNCRQLSLFGGFSLRLAGTRVPLPMHAERVLAYLSIHKMSNDDCDRCLLAERLWPESSVERSRASLRTAMWRIRGVDAQLLVTHPGRVALADGVAVDVHDFRRQAEDLLTYGGAADPTVRAMLPNPADLLPGWDEDWLTLTREQLRLLRLHALEQRAKTLCAHGHYPRAIDLILGVVSDEPLRESAQTVLIEAHLCQGNMFEARRQFARFADELWSQLQLRPSERLVRLVHGNLPT